MKSVYSAVRTGSLNKAVCASSLNGLIFAAQQRVYKSNQLALLTYCTIIQVSVRSQNMDNIKDGSQNFPELLKKICLKYFYKFETLFPFKSLPPVSGCSDPSGVPTAGNTVHTPRSKRCQGRTVIPFEPLQRQQNALSIVFQLRRCLTL